MKIAAFGSAFLLTSILMSDPGHAASVTYNVKGTVSSIYSDNFSYFDASLVGKEFFAKIAFELMDADIDVSPVQTNVANNLNLTPIPGRVSLAIGSTTYSFPINQYQIQTAYSTTIANLISSTDPDFEYIYFLLSSGLLSDGISPLPETPLEASQFQYGRFFGDATTGYQSAVLLLTPTSLEITTGVSAVPLPPSLPMFGAALLGLGALGYGARRKTKAAA